MRVRLPKPVRKLPYYLSSLAALSQIATARSIVRCVVLADKRLDFRDGRSLHLSSVLDLLVVKETLVDDVYGLSGLDADDGIIVDVGAGIGEFTLEAARRFPNLTVCAYEPNPAAFNLLVLNVRGHGYANIELAPVAIGRFEHYVLRDSTSGPRASAASGGSAEGGVLVRARRLDEVVPKTRIRLLKIDCEGLELDVLRSATGVMDRVEKAVVEFHKHLLPEADQVVDEFLRSCGLRTQLRTDRFDDMLGYVCADRPTDRLSRT